MGEAICKTKKGEVGRGKGGKSDCFCTIEHVHPEAGVEVADWGLTRPLAVPEELDQDGGVVFAVHPSEGRGSGFPVPRALRGGDGPMGGTLSSYGREVPGMFSLKSQVHSRGAQLVLYNLSAFSVSKIFQFV